VAEPGEDTGKAVKWWVEAAHDERDPIVEPVERDRDRAGRPYGLDDLDQLRSRIRTDEINDRGARLLEMAGPLLKNSATAIP
jgi:hypothetical protein